MINNTTSTFERNFAVNECDHIRCIVVTRWLKRLRLASGIPFCTPS